MADMAASVLARLKNKAAERGRSYQLCLHLFLPGGVSAPTGKVQICGKPRAERRIVHLLPYFF